MTTAEPLRWPRYHMLEWQPFPEVRPPKITCLYSDGVATFWAGWYTSDEGVGIYLPAGDGSATLMSPEMFNRVRWWARLDNFLAQTQSLYEVNVPGGTG